MKSQLVRYTANQHRCSNLTSGGIFAVSKEFYGGLIGLSFKGEGKYDYKVTITMRDMGRLVKAYEEMKKESK